MSGLLENMSKVQKECCLTLHCKHNKWRRVRNVRWLGLVCAFSRMRNIL